MGPTVVGQDVKTEPSEFSRGIAEYIIVKSSSTKDESENEFSQEQSSSSDGDASLSDDMFTAYHGSRDARGRSDSKENRLSRRIVIGGGASRSGSDEYYRRRQRNNAAVKRSRDRARQRQKESLRRLAELTAENRRLHLKADTLIKELSLLRGFFPAALASSDGLVPDDELDLATEEIVLEADTFLSEASQ